MSDESDKSPPIQHGCFLNASRDKSSSLHLSHADKSIHGAGALDQRLHRLVVNSDRLDGEFFASAAYSRIFSIVGVMPIMGFAFIHLLSSNTSSSSSSVNTIPK